MKSIYLMTEEEIETLAAERTQAIIGTDQLDGTYLRALVTGAQSKLGAKKGKRPPTDSQLAALESIAVPFYAAVLRGVTTQDIALEADIEHGEASRRARERNRRATFARSAKSTLVAWVNEGGDIRALEAMAVSKGELRASVTAAKAERGVPAASRVERAQNAILTAVAREGPDAAREHLEGVIAALQGALDELPVETPHHESTTIRTRAGVPTFREPARVLNRAA